MEKNMEEAHGYRKWHPQGLDLNGNRHTGHLNTKLKSVFLWVDSQGHVVQPSYTDSKGVEQPSRTLYARECDSNVWLPDWNPRVYPPCIGGARSYKLLFVCDLVASLFVENPDNKPYLTHIEDSEGSLGNPDCKYLIWSDSAGVIRN